MLTASVVVPAPPRAAEKTTRRPDPPAGSPAPCRLLASVGYGRLASRQQGLDECLQLAPVEAGVQNVVCARLDECDPVARRDSEDGHVLADARTQAPAGVDGRVGSCRIDDEQVVRLARAASGCCPTDLLHAVAAGNERLGDAIVGGPAQRYEQDLCRQLALDSLRRHSPEV